RGLVRVGRREGPRLTWTTHAPHAPTPPHTAVIPTPAACRAASTVPPTSVGHLRPAGWTTTTGRGSARGTGGRQAVLVEPHDGGVDLDPGEQGVPGLGQLVQAARQ